MNIIEIIIISLAVWRLASLLTKEAGPFHIFEKIRELAGIEHNVDGQIFMVPDKFFAELFSCVWCSSVWIGGVLTVCYLLWPVCTFYIALPFALSALAIAYSGIVSRL